MKGLIIGASIGNCVHVGGVLNFLRLAEEQGYKTRFLGPAVPVKYLLDAVLEADPVMVAVGYRLTPETGYQILSKLKNSARERGLDHYKFVFGGTLPVGEQAKKVGLFAAVFSGLETREEILAFLHNRDLDSGSESFGSTLQERIGFKKPYPLIRHHFGLPDMSETVAGIKKIAESKVLDIISLGPDQNAQEHFFRPGEMDEDEKGAGGVPIRCQEDLENLYQASRCGNYPLMRCYSGTRDVFKMAELLQQTIDNAWAAVPLCWYNKLDGRGPRGVLDSIAENQRLMKWHADRKIPVEVNESHHWSLRDAHDTIAVVMAFLAAYNAKKMGVSTYLAQYMFNNPAGTSAKMDLAKMWAKKELIEDLQDEKFQVLTQVRAGLASFPPDLNKARGQLAYSTFLGMALKPEILHVVSYSEADHAATAEDVISSCLIARQVIENLLDDYPDFTKDESILNRKQELIKEAEVLLKAVERLIVKKDVDPYCDPETICRAIKSGLIDAPHLQGNSAGAGILKTRMINGACYAYDFNEERVINEEERIKRLGEY